MSEMRTLGEVIMIAAALALVAVAFAAGYQRFDRPLRALLGSGEWPVLRSPFRLKFFDRHSAWAVFLPLFLVLGVGWVLRHYG
jgi:hypothetical protein